jgi:hypothetical protein
MKRLTSLLACIALLAPGCATDGGSATVGAGFYGDWYYYDDIWYGGGCCVNPPDNIGSAPRPEHPIALPPDGIGPPRPAQPIALPDAKPKAGTSSASSSANRSAAPRMSSMPRGGGGRGGGRR